MARVWLQFNKEDFIKMPDGSYEHKDNDTFKTVKSDKVKVKKSTSMSAGYPISPMSRNLS